MKRDVVLAPTPRHACARAATSSCETFISLITASCGRPGGHRRAWARRVGARQPDLRCYRCYPRSAPPSYGLSNEPRNCKLNPETGSAAAVFGYPGTAQIDALGRHCRCQNLITPCASAVCGRRACAPILSRFWASAAGGHSHVAAGAAPRRRWLWRCPDAAPVLPRRCGWRNNAHSAACWPAPEGAQLCGAGSAAARAA